ncbi:MAG TPA: RDD family protein [Epsilonproteobacteria bacterium]|nr:RDD family protein [Campylobacterota bacterium]HHH37731.1 RDD family protein [Campylobacterota bacterium]
MAQTRRFRDVKQKKPAIQKKKKTKEKPSNQTEALDYASIGSKAKAFITDMFMLMMPIMYLIVYLVFGSLQAFSEHKAAGWAYMLIPNFIIVFLFFWRSGQTPGCRAYEIKLVDSKTGQKAHPLAIALRYYFELISMVTVIGMMMAWFRKDRKCLHDLLSGTVLVKAEPQKER